MQDTVPNALFLLSLKVQTITWFKVLHYSDPPYFPQFSYTYVRLVPLPNQEQRETAITMFLPCFNNLSYHAINKSLSCHSVW